VTPTNSAHRQIARAAAVVMITFVASRLLGLLRDVIISAHFGTSDALDAYYAASRLNDLIFTLIAGGALASAFIPTFAGYLARDDDEGAWRLASNIINIMVLVLAVVSLLAAIFAFPLVSDLLGIGFDVEKQKLTAELLRFLLIAPTIFGVSGVIMGMLNAKQNFWLPGLAPSLYNLGMIGGVIFLSSSFGIYGLAIGAVVGAALHLIVQVPGLISARARYTPRLGLRDPGVRQVFRLMAPRVLGLATVQLNFIVETILASTLSTGAVSALNYAWRVMLLPQGVVAQSVAIAAFPTFSDQFARGKIDELRSALSATLRVILFIAIPSAVGLLVLRVPLIQLLFERGQFQDTSTELVATALGFYALGLIGHSGVEILTRAFYGMHDTRTPVILSIVSLVLNLVLSLALIGVMQIAGLALANTIAILIEMILLIFVLRRRLHGLGDRRLIMTTLKTIAASIAMSIGVIVFLNLTASTGVIIRGLGSMIIGAGIFTITAWLLRVEELRLMSSLVLRRVKPSPANKNAE
jgi:putative peptidoglycan lipid II flippase